MSGPVGSKHQRGRAGKAFGQKGRRGEEVFEAYAQNKTPGAYRVFFIYGPHEGEGKKRVAIITIVAVTPHP